MVEVPVYIPRPGEGSAREQRQGAFAATLIEPASAIVGAPDASPDEHGLVVIYFEGNKYNAANMVTFADRAMFAYWRMSEHYPTVATMAAPLSQLQRVGTLYPEHRRVEVKDAAQLVALARWLGLERDYDELHVQLRAEGVRR